jgi:hypothetical protein
VFRRGRAIWLFDEFNAQAKHANVAGYKNNRSSSVSHLELGSIHTVS